MSTEYFALSELLEAVIDNRGRTCPTAASGRPLIATNCISNDHLYPLIDNLRFVDQATYENWFRGHPRPGDILFVLKGDPGRCCLVPDPITFCVAQDMVALRPDVSLVEPSYLFAALRSPFVREAINNMHVGTMIPHFKKGDFDKLKLPIPDRPTQRAIGSLYMHFEKKIEGNRRMNETLEAIARAIFRDWFVDFGPTRAKMEGRPPYLAPEIWALFPDRLDNEGKPEGWNITRLGHQVEVTKGRSYTSSELAPSNTALVTLKSFARGGGYRRDGLKSYTGDYKQSQILTDGEIIVAQTDVTQAADIIGRPARVIVDQRFETLVASLDVAILRPINEASLDREFVYGITRDDAFTQHAKAHSSGTTVLHLSKHAIPNFEFPLPSKTLIARHFSIAEPLIRRIAANIQEGDALASVRDLLLPRLMSGEINVTDAERIAEEGR